MKQLRLLAIAIIMGMFVALPVVTATYAQEDGDTDTETSESTEDTSEEEPSERPTQDRPTDEERDAAAEARRQERADAREAALSAAQEARIAARCANAQEKLQAAITRASAVESNRQDIYSNVSSKLADIVSRLDATNIDTAELSSEIADYESQVTSFFSTFDNYELALQDAASIDCESDPEGFVLALEDARDLRAQLKSAAEDIKSYVRGTILVTLQEIKELLDSVDTESDENNADDSSEES